MTTEKPITPTRGRPRKATPKVQPPKPKRPRLPENWASCGEVVSVPETEWTVYRPLNLPRAPRPRLPEWLFSRGSAPQEAAPQPQDRSLEAMQEWSRLVSTNPPPGTAVIPLTRGLAALVDQADHAELSEFKWQASQHRGQGWYAQRAGRLPGGRRTVPKMHRQILRLTDPEILADHVNGHGLDNRRSNLRPASRRQNLRNSRPRSGTSHFKGVSWERSTGKWRAQIRVDSRQRLLGRFASEEEAARAYDRAALEAFGSFARVNLAA